MFGFQNPVGLPLLGIDSYLLPPNGFASLLVLSDATGNADYRFQMPVVPPTGFAVQSAWLGGCARGFGKEAGRGHPR